MLHATGFWKVFRYKHLLYRRFFYYFSAFCRMGGRPLNVQEPNDALEFFNGVAHCIDNGLKMLGHEELVSKVFGGSYADQKICQGCPHRYVRKEKFVSLSVDICHCSHLLESLEQNFKGDLIAGKNAYYCEKCNKRVRHVFSFFNFLENCAGCRLTL